MHKNEYFCSMKRVLILALSLIFLNLQAQQQPVLKNKRGIAILPKKGEYGLGISAMPFFSYFGNMFNNSTSNSGPVFTFAGPGQTIFAKFMKSNDLAYRAAFRIGINNNTKSYNVLDISPGAAANAVVSDLHKQRNSNIGLSFGLEKRKGITRLQGIYGVEGFINFSSGKTLYEYGNKLEYLDTNTTRVKKMNSSTSFSIGFRGFAGVEYFIAPNFSIGGELGYGPSFSIGSAEEQTTEQYDFSTATAREELKQITPASKGFSLDTDNYNGIIKVQFYF